MGLPVRRSSARRELPMPGPPDAAPPADPAAREPSRWWAVLGGTAVIIGMMLLGAWLTSGPRPAPGQPWVEEPPPEPGRPPVEVLEVVAADLRAVPPDHRADVRYLSFAHLTDRKAVVHRMLHRSAPANEGSPLRPRGLGLRDLADPDV